jgi:hypothetical protein
MNHAEALHIRREAGFLADDGDLPGALEHPDRLVIALSATDQPAGGQELHQLCGALADRAGLRRYANDVVGALADIERAERMLAGAPIAIQRAHHVSLLQVRARILLDPENLGDYLITLLIFKNFRSSGDSVVGF